MADIKKWLKELVKLTVLEVNWKIILKKEHGIEPAAAAVAVAGQLLVVTPLLLTKKLSSQLLKDAGSQKVASHQGC